MEKRKINRKPFFSGEMVYSKLKCKTYSEDVSLVNVSISGFQVLASKIGPEFEKGIIATLEFSPNYDQNLVMKGELVEVNKVPSGEFRLSFKTESESKNEDADMIELRPFFYPTGSFENPFRFLDMIYFQISSLSSKRLTMITSVRNSQIIPGIKVRANVFLPGIGQSNLAIKIISSQKSIKHEDRIICVAQFDSDDQFLEYCVDWLLMSGSEKTLKDLKSQGFPVSSAVKGFEITYPISDEDMTKIMDLRLKAQHNEGRFLDVKDSSIMLDRFDSHSRHIIARVGGRVVGATRLVFNNGDENKTEHGPMGAKIPDWLWKAGFVESSRSVTDPDYRGSDLFVSMTRHMGRVVLQAGLRYMLFSCEDKLRKFYERSGGKFISYFVCDDIPDIKWTLMYMDILNSSLGKHGGLLNWNIVQAPMFPFVQRSGKLKPSIIDKIRLSFYKKFEGTAKALYKKHKKKRSKKRPSQK